MEDQHSLNNAIEGELQQAAQYIRSQHLRDLVHTPDRAALCLQFEDLTVDCTRQPITLKILEKLVMLACLLYTSPSPRDAHESRMPSSA